MPSIPFQDRPYQLFVSYAHEDRDIVSALVEWLRKIAGVSVWHDDRLGAGSMIVTDLPDALQSATGALFVLSNASARSGWVKEEYSTAIRERTENREYRILVLKIDDTEPPAFLSTTRWIDVPAGVLTPESGLDLLLGLYGDRDPTPAAGRRDLYVSRSWRANEAAAADEVCRILVQSGYRLVGDSTDWNDFDSAARIPSLIRSCGTLIAIVPDRGGQSSPYVEEEIRTAVEAGVPCVAVLVDDSIKLAASGSAALPPDLRLKLDDVLSRNDVLTDILREVYRPAQQPHYVFYAASLLKAERSNRHVRQLVEAVTGVECVLGANLAGEHAQAEIVKRIRGALLMIADVSEEAGINTLIEAGVALGAGTRLRLLARGDPRPPRFMFRDREVSFYRDELDLLGIVHRLVRPYRRRIMNRELKDAR